jgi:AIR synthase-related protein
MNLDGHDLSALVAALHEHEGLLRKQDVQAPARALAARSSAIRNGDDAAAIPDRDGTGYTLLAAEGMLPAFVAREPFFAGFCAVMTNVSDIAAMGGRAQAIVDVLFTGESNAEVGAVLEGLAAGAELFGVPIVGGHTARSPNGTYLSAAIVGRASRLITSFDARPGDVILACVDLRGAFRGDTANFDAVSGAEPARVRAQLELLPQLAEAGLVHAGKDISMAGMLGTLLMLLEMSDCGAVVDVGAIPAPPEAQHDPARWLRAFPSFGYLLATPRRQAREVIARFDALGVHAAAIADVHASTTLDLSYKNRTERFWDLEERPLLGIPHVSGTLKGQSHA